MTKEQLTQFAEAGVALKVADLERELADYHHQYPHLFLSATPPQLLKAPLKNGNGRWPAITRRTTPDSPAARTALIRAYLTTTGAARSRDIRDHLAQQGYPLSPSPVIKLLHGMPDVAMRGYGKFALWGLKTHWDSQVPQKTVPAPKTRTVSLAARKKLSAAMRRRHASGEIARAKAKAAKKGL